MSLVPTWDEEPESTDYIEVMRAQVEEWINERVSGETGAFSLDMLMVAKQMTLEKVAEVYDVPVSWVKIEAQWADETRTRIQVNAVIFKPADSVWIKFNLE